MPSTRDQRPYNVSYYHRNRQREIDRVTTRQRATLAFPRELRRVPCLDCGGTFRPHRMEFDHRDPSTKSFQVTDSGLRKNRKRLLAEIATGDIVCANCHAARTYALHGQRRAERRANGTLKSTPRRVAQRERKAEGRAFVPGLRDRPCMDCGNRFPPFVMQFDHRDPSTKTFLVSQTWLSSKARIIREVAKCDIVCANCHRDRTYRCRTASAGVL
jgi:hypothetical protein